MPQHISIINLKGGTGSSSLSTNLAHLLALQSYTVVLIECDMQGNSSSLLSRRESPTLTHFLQGEVQSSSVIKSSPDRLGIILSDSDPDTAATYIAGRRHSSLYPKSAVQRLRCDFVIFDHAPSYSAVTEAALLVSSEILIPCELAPFAIQALFQVFCKLDETLRNDKLVNSRIVPFYIDYRYLITRWFLSELEQKFGDIITPMI